MAINCKNCSADYSGNFCPNCGQKAATHDIDSKYILHEIPHAIFHVDKGIFYTIYQLSSRPGKSVLEYIRGKRVKHYSPIAYILLLSAVFLLVNKFTTTISTVHFTSSAGEAYQERLEHMLGFILLCFAPVFALFYSLFFGRRSGLNYWQFLVANTFFIGHIIFVLIVMQLLITPFVSSLPRLVQSNVFTQTLLLYQLVASAQLLWPFYQQKLLLVATVFAAIILSAISCALIFAGFIKLAAPLLLHH